MQKSFINLIEALKQQFNASLSFWTLNDLVWFHHCAAELLMYGPMVQQAWAQLAAIKDIAIQMLIRHWKARYLKSCC